MHSLNRSRLCYLLFVSPPSSLDTHKPTLSNSVGEKVIKARKLCQSLTAPRKSLTNSRISRLPVSKMQIPSDIFPSLWFRSPVSMNAYISNHRIRSDVEWSTFHLVTTAEAASISVVLIAVTFSHRLHSHFMVVFGFDTSQEVIPQWHRLRGRKLVFRLILVHIYTFFDASQSMTFSRCHQGGQSGGGGWL